MDLELSTHNKYNVLCTYLSSHIIIMQRSTCIKRIIHSTANHPTRMSQLAAKHLGAFILLLLVTFISFCTTQNTYYVKPTPDTPCHGDPCYTLSEYAGEAEQYFTSNTTMVLLPGEHALQSDVTAKNGVRFVLQHSSSSSTQIMCINNTFTFANFSSIEITGLSFISCRFHLYKSQAFFRGNQFKNCAANYGGAIKADYSTIDFAGINHFEGNIAALVGGGIYAVGSNLTIHGDILFLGNSVGGYLTKEFKSGYSSWEESGFLESSGHGESEWSGHGESEWLDSSSGGESEWSESNGHMVTKWLESINWEPRGCDSLFESSKGGESERWNPTKESPSGWAGPDVWSRWWKLDYGGGLYAHNSTVTFYGPTSFEGNWAALAGGGIFANKSNLTFRGNTTFMNNCGEAGGAMFVVQSYLNFYGKVHFKNNLVGPQSKYGYWTAEDWESIIWNMKHWWPSSLWDYLGMWNSIMSESGWWYSRGWDALSYWSSWRNIMWKSGWWMLDHGGALYADRASITFEGETGFEGNSAVVAGGGIFAEESNPTFHGRTTFNNNEAMGRGGGVYMWNSTVSFDGNNTFVHNSAEDSGGGVCMWNSTVSFNGNNCFVHNSAEDSGGGVCMWNSTVSFVGNNTFVHNSAEYSGGGACMWKSIVSFNTIAPNSASSASSGGGGIGGSSLFTHNLARYGGGIQAQSSAVNIASICSLMYNTAQEEGGGIHLMHSSTLSIDRESHFTENSASYFGGGVASLHSMVDIIGTSYFTNNSGKYGGGIYADKSKISCNGTTSFLANSVIQNGYSDGHGGAIHLLSSNLTFVGTLGFTNNSAGYGGAIALSGLDHSKMYFWYNTTMIFKGNVALHHGGALHVEDNPFTYCVFESNLQSRLREACFIQLFDHHELMCNRYNSIPVSTIGDAEGIQVLFHDNVAIEAGSLLYGGNLDTCAIYNSPDNWGQCLLSTGTAAFYRYSNIISSEVASISDISSDPYRVCVCEDSQPDCSETVITHEVYPGETIHIPVVAVGQWNGTTPAVISADLEGLEIGNLQNTQTTNKTCNLLQYTVLATEPEKDNRSIILYADEPCSRSGFPLKIAVKFRSCPDGFSLSTQGRCTCEERLQRYTTECDINDQSIQRRSEFWVGFDNQSRGLILHPHCPFDYCKSGTINITLNNSDVQCDHNRSGILCGACQQHLSLTLGSSQCLPCSNTFISSVVLFAIAGFALVIFLFICKLTVAAGTISGLIFYANIIAVNKTVLFPSGDTNILTVFIAWLNLDLGIDTCFFNGMDAYSMTWLQFVFPIYIWLLVGLIAVLSNVSITIAKILSSVNPVAILAALFLLSYTKLLRTIIAAFSFTSMEYPDDETKVVWLYDGNIGYLDKNDGRHIALFLASLLVFLFLFLPYTLFLLFGQCILPRLDPNKLRCLSWTNYLRMKSFLDAYHAPYKDRHRYWMGLLLLVRFVLFLVSATVDIKSPQDPHVNLLVILISTVGLAIWVWNVGGMYKKWYLNALESSFILNLVLLSATTLYVKLAGGNQAAVFYTSVTIAFATFIGIITYHVCQRVIDTRLWRNIIRKIHYRRQPCEIPMEEVPPAPIPPPTVTFVDMAVLREPLLST